MATVVTGDQSIRIGNKLAEIQRQLYLQRDGYPYNPLLLEEHLQAAVEGKFVAGQKQKVVISKPKLVILSLLSTPPTLADWLKAREELHQFFTGEKVILRDIFSLTDEQLASTTLMPALRPAGATNRMAVEWKIKMGENKPYEEIDVIKYSRSKGPKNHELLLINRSVKPDADTLGDHAKSPDDLIQVKGKLWLNLFGWCDADTLHAAITGKHLDPETWTWFPNDRLPGGGVANGCWSPDRRQVCLGWGYAAGRHSSYGARVAILVPLTP